MGLFRRVNDIITANLNDMVERFEDPEKMLKQAIREMEALIDDVTASAAKAIASEKLVLKELAEHEQQVGCWQVRAEQAVRTGDDELARQFLRRKNEHAKIVHALRDQLTAARRSGASLRRQIQAMRAKHAEAKRKLATLAARSRAAQARQRFQAVAVGSGRHTEAFARFDRMCEKVELAEAEADALADLNIDCDDPNAASFAVQEDELAIETELATLKKNQRRGDASGETTQQ